MKKFVISFLITLVVMSGLYMAYDTFIVGRDKPIVSTSSNAEEGEVDEEEPEVIMKKPNEIFFVLLGVDGNGLKREQGLRSDVIILTSVNLDTGKINMLQVNRDTRVLVKGSKDKINAAHSYGGPELAIRTLRDYLDVDVNYYVKVDFKGVMDIVDSVGGVEFDVPVRMRYNDPTAKPPLNIKLDKGLQVLDGKNSHDLLRFRHNNGTDFYPEGLSREQVQQDWIKAFIKTVLQPKNIFKLPEIINTGYNSIDTNIPLNVILGSVPSIGNIDLENITTHSIPGEGHIIKNGGWYFFPDMDKQKELVEEMFGDNIIER